MAQSMYIMYILHSIIAYELWNISVSYSIFLYAIVKASMHGRGCPRATAKCSDLGFRDYSLGLGFRDSGLLRHGAIMGGSWDSVTRL